MFVCLLYLSQSQSHFSTRFALKCSIPLNLAKVTRSLTPMYCLCVCAYPKAHILKKNTGWTKGFINWKTGGTDITIYKYSLICLLYNLHCTQTHTHTHTETHANIQTPLSLIELRVLLWLITMVALSPKLYNIHTNVYKLLTTTVCMRVCMCTLNKLYHIYFHRHHFVRILWLYTYLEYIVLYSVPKRYNDFVFIRKRTKDTHSHKYTANEMEMMFGWWGAYFWGSIWLRRMRRAF